ARREIVTPALRDHERQRAHVPGATLKLDERSACQILADQVPWQVSPAEAGLEQVAFGAQVVDQPLALAGYTLLALFGAGLVVRDDDLYVSAKLVHRDGFGCRSERIGRRAYRHHLLLAQPVAFDGLRVHFWHVVDGDGQRAHFFEHQLFAALHGGDAQVDRGGRKLFLQRAQAVDQVGAREVGVDRHRYLRHAGLGDRAGAVLHFLRTRDHRPGVRQKAAPRRGELGLARVALEQLDVERTLQRLDRVADGRLRPRELARGTREAALVAHRNERTQLVDGDVVEHRLSRK